jgi:hypothetical protein
MRATIGDVTWLHLKERKEKSQQSTGRVHRLCTCENLCHSSSLVS